MQRAKKQLVLKKYTYYIFLSSIFLLNFNALNTMENNNKHRNKRNKSCLSTKPQPKLQPSEKFLTSNPNQIDYFSSLPIELIAFITLLLLENPLNQEKQYPDFDIALRAVLQDVTSFALINKAMMLIFSDTESDFAKQAATYLTNNITIKIVLSRDFSKINNRDKLIVPFLKVALKNHRDYLLKQFQINLKWMESLKQHTAEALKTLKDYQELTYAPHEYTIFGLNGFALDSISTLFTIFYSGVELKKIHYNSSIQVKKFYDWHFERRSHYCTLLSFALDMVNFSKLQDKPFDFIKLLIAQGADHSRICTIPTCKYPTPWQEAKEIQTKDPRILALFDDNTN